jgi:two-component system response regulator HydG
MLPELVKDGRFRDDLYYRLNVITLTVPPLRARATDIPQLAQSFLARARERAPQSPVSAISRELLDLLCHGSWPGNVRELQSTIERLVVLAMADTLEARHLALVDEELMPPVSGAPVVVGPRAPLELCGIDELVHRHVDAVLAHTDGNKARAAKILGIDLSTLYRWQQKWQT